MLIVFKSDITHRIAAGFAVGVAAIMVAQPELCQSMVIAVKMVVGIA